MIAVCVSLTGVSLTGAIQHCPGFIVGPALAMEMVQINQSSFV